VGQSKGEPREREGSGVGEHVTGIGEQRQRPGQQAACRLDGHEAAREQHGPEDSLLVVARGGPKRPGEMVV
jgi:hypothetical protein